jgi:hypothetical protein
MIGRRIDVDADDGSIRAAEIAQRSAVRAGVLGMPAPSAANVEHRRRRRQEGLNARVEFDGAIDARIAAKGNLRIRRLGQASGHSNFSKRDEPPE